MTTPKKGDLVIVREKKGAFKRDKLYLAECAIGQGYHTVGLERLSDRLPIIVDVDAHSDSKFTIEEVIPKEKLPKTEDKSPQPGHFVPANEWSRYEEFCKHYPSTPEDVFPSLYPLEVGDEVEIYQYDRATGFYSGEPGRVIGSPQGKMANVMGQKSLKRYSVVAETGIADGTTKPTYVHITRKHKPKQNMCNKKFEYKPGQKFYTPSGIKFEVVSVAGDIAYARCISEPMWFTRIEYADGKHVCVDDSCVTFKLIDPPLVAEAKEMVKLLHEYPEKFDKMGEHTLRNLHHWLFVAQ